MWRYLKAAFLARPGIPGLGHVPVNLLAVTCLGILGFVNPGFWFLGAGLETAYLALLVGNRRFRDAIDAIERAAQPRPDPALAEQALQQRLAAPARRVLLRIESGCARILQLQEQAHVDAYVLEAHRETLGRLRWTALKLLVAQANLQSDEWDESEESIRQRIATIDREIAAAPSAGVRESHEATRAILQRRIANRGERQRQLAEISADLARIEAQIELARENASIQGRPLTIASDVALASGLLDFGSAAPEIADVEQRMAPPKVNA
ncbi:MAG: hypothetical protein J0M02_14210 [Planctomycetes bacterium]|nr:hypothetical protein [Planctomycetota bacterium]